MDVGRRGMDIIPGRLEGASFYAGISQSQSLLDRVQLTAFCIPFARHRLFDASNTECSALL